MQSLVGKQWHSILAQDALRLLETNVEQGLTEEEVRERQKRFGKNALPEEKYASKAEVFLRQLKSPLIFILLFASIITFLIGHLKDSAVIFSAVLLNSFIGYFEEYKATSTLAQLKLAVKQKARVLRQGSKKEVPQDDLVLGDIVFLAPGDKVPADGRIVKSWDLKIQEAVLTGEWLASDKTHEALSEKTPLADRDNMAHMGSFVEEGEGIAVVVAIGNTTEIGKVAFSIQEVREGISPYQARILAFSHVIGRVVGALVLFIFLEGLIAGRGILELFLVAVAVAVGAIPEGLPIAMTAILAVGMRRILRRGGLVKNLFSAETLGSTTVIATDKTLTLTEGKMEIEELWTRRPEDRDDALRVAALANEAFIENPEAMFEEWNIKGRPTDQALLRGAMEAGVSRVALEKAMPLIEKIPFSSERKFMASFNRQGDRMLVSLTGAPETVLTLVSGVAGDEQRLIDEKILFMTGQGLRVMAFATGQLPLKGFAGSFRALEFVGLVALKDPLRKGAKEAMHGARAAGIRTILVTGDHALTATAVAKELGLDGKKGTCITGEALDEMGEQELLSRLEDITVYARVEPSHKLRIIEAWQKKGEVVAMTGDGVNDAPALQKANIGIALGSGTDVAKEAADLILLKDQFPIILAAIEEGRIIIDNIRKVITYMLSGTFTETILIGASILFSWPLPVTALQILWVNLVEDGLPGIALTFEKGEKDVMKRKPEGKKVALLNPPMKVIIFAVSIFTDILLLGIFAWLLNYSSYSLEHTRTIMFVGLALTSLFYIFSCKSLRKNIWEYNPFSNQYLTLSVLLGVVLLISVVYIPFLQGMFHTTSLNMLDWLALCLLAAVAVVLIELAKWYFLKRDRMVR